MEKFSPEEVKKLTYNDYYTYRYKIIILLQPLYEKIQNLNMITCDQMNDIREILTELENLMITLIVEYIKSKGNFSINAYCRASEIKQTLENKLILIQKYVNTNGAEKTGLKIQSSLCNLETINNNTFVSERYTNDLGIEKYINDFVDEVYTIFMKISYIINLNIRDLKLLENSVKDFQNMDYENNMEHSGKIFHINPNNAQEEISKHLSDLLKS